MNLTLIMAQGHATRWGNGTFKHLAAFNGVPMLTRVCQQVQERDTDGIVIGWAEYEGHTAGLGLMSMAKPGRDVCFGILDTAHLWQGYDRVIILLGDVVYSQATIDLIYSDTGSLRFYGRIEPGRVTGKTVDERYGFWFRPGVVGDYIKKCVKEVIADEACVPALKSLYQHLIGAPRHYPHPAKPMVYWDDIVLTEVNDYTDDFDHYEEYLEARAAVEAAIRAEEESKEPMSQ